MNPAGSPTTQALIAEADKWIEDAGHWAKKARGLPDDGTRCASDLIFDLTVALRAAADALRSLAVNDAAFVCARHPDVNWRHHWGCADCLRTLRIEKLAAEAEVARLTQARDEAQDMSNIFTTTPANIATILMQRFGQGDPGSGLSMDVHEAHMLMGYFDVSRTDARQRQLEIEHLRAEVARLTQGRDTAKALEPLRQVLADWTFQLESAERFNTDVAHVVKVATLRQCLSDVRAGIGAAEGALGPLPPTEVEQKDE